MFLNRPPPPRTLTSLRFYHLLACCAPQAGRRASERVIERESASTEPLARVYVDGLHLLPRNQVVVVLDQSCLARFAHVASQDLLSNATFQKREGGRGVYAIDLIVASTVSDVEVRPHGGDW